ncbi:RHS repeat domain-containing protein [Myroides odoratus]|uniref:RHS repeat domain-containing protein n=1 Tax=Myroides odoratus TaxID=256 RepID=UPI0039AF1945
MKQAISSIWMYLFCVVLYGQQSVVNQSLLRNSELLPPEVMKIQEYGDYTLNQTKGAPNISIPIYTIQTKTGFNFPIRLNYVSNGIKVEEVASNVGLGWALDTFGVITVEGDLNYDIGANIKSDLINYSNQEVTNTNMASMNVFSYLEIVKRGTVSSKTPTYHYSFLGHSGKFIIDSKGGIQGIPRTDLTIKVVNNGDVISILDVEGNTYKFVKHQNLISYSPSSIYQAPKLSVFYVLEEITLRNKEKIEFTYATSDRGGGFMRHHQVSYDYNVNYNNLKAGTTTPTTIGRLTCDRNSWPENVTSKVYGNNLNMRIQQIKYGDVRVVFRGSEEAGLEIDGQPYRKDIGTSSSAIRKIEVLFQNKTIESFVLDYTYFVSQDTNEDKPEKYRLKLNAITQNQTSTHRFDYYEDTKLPSRDSFAQDIWGFYNGNLSNRTLLPAVSFQKGESSFSFAGANREVGRLAEARAFTLKRITYPTQGYTDFSYNQIIHTQKQIVEREVTIGSLVSINANEEDVFTRTKRISLRELGYNKETDTLYLIALNGCDNGKLSTESGLDQLSPTRSNGHATISVEGGYTVAPSWTYHKTGLLTAKSLTYGPIRPVGDIVTASFTRHGECAGRAGVRINRKVYDTITLKKAIGPIYLQAYHSYDHSGVLEKEVEYQYRSDLSAAKDVVEVNYVAPILAGISKIEKENVETSSGSDVGQALKKRNCYAIVRSSAPMNNVKEYYFPYIHEVVKGKGRTYYQYRGTVNTAVNSIVSSEPFYDFEKGSSLEINRDYEKGYLKSQAMYNEKEELILSLRHIYENDNSFVTQSKDYCFGTGISYDVVLLNRNLTMTGSIQLVPNYYYRYTLIPINSTWIKKKEEISTEKTATGLMTRTVKYGYNNANIMLPTVKTSLVNAEEFTEHYTYPSINTPLYNSGKGTLLKTAVLKNGEPIQTLENIYKDWGNNLFDIEEIKVTKGANNPESNQKVLSRLANGNSFEIESQGVKTVYLYGYNQSVLLAKIENASKEQVARALGVTVANLVTVNETQLSRINNLRTNATLKEAFITTYEHQPLIGITKITDAKGTSVNYEYDASNRLKAIKDDQGNILESYEYNYKNN